MSDPDELECNECGYTWKNCDCYGPDEELAKVNPVGGSGEKDRGSWCTPKWLADALGRFNLDPCSNPRSHVSARFRCSLEEDLNGLCEEERPGVFQFLLTSGEREIMEAGERWETFVNPPYARGQVARWVKHYKHTRFTFLLRWDPSTDWFGELIRKCTHIWFPSRRINFEPPPGVKGSANPYPHALFMRQPPADRLLRLAPLGYLIPVDTGLFAPQS